MVVQSRKQAAWKQIVVALVVAGVMAGGVMQVMYPNPCKGKTPSDWEYWQYSCWAYAYVGGSPSFIVR